ncbi:MULTISPECIES: carbohydrate-binding protein [Streptacidiphilus]|uniref:Carbohydrate-binding protein n=2 Tax=Streptacidiphilus TaxID=228398 RepID=A0ABV6UEA3_9ACTN|nr:carbohydrate-binding protein [Streptacidiphilus jeojiense]
MVAIGGSSAQASVTPAATTALSSNWYAAAPYLMPLDNNPPNPVDVMNATGLKAFQLAFILAPSGGGCTPTWGGTAPVSSDTAVASTISSIRAAGGDVSVSIGGYGGTKLGQTCGTPAATAAAYQQVITKYGLHAMDFDLEEPEYENTAAVANEIGAAQILQQNNPGLYISITTAGTAAGTGWFGTQMLNQAKTDGFTPNNFSIMPFDGGFNGAASQISALQAFNSLLMSTFGWSSATAYAHEGISMMNGRSDSGEYFYQSDFQSVLNFATSNGLARYTNWSVNRDRQCTPADNNGQTSGTCSSVTQGAWDFTKYSVQFAGATPPTSTPTTAAPTTAAPTTAAPTTAAPTGGSCTAAAWSATATYTQGNTVTYNGHSWTAKWWTYGDIPGGSAGVWTDNGAC